jgi:hypothetical protein
MTIDKERIEKKTALRTTGPPEEVASLVACLASDAHPTLQARQSR